MEIHVLTVTLHLEGCDSLKAKRHRLTGLKKRLGRELFLSVIESNYQDKHQSAEWSLTVIADSPAQSAQRISWVEQAIAEGLDARVLEFSQERIF